MAKFVRYGPSDRYGTPEAGFCASSFVLARTGGKVLAGIPKDHPRWREEWAPNFSVYSPEELADEFRSWRLPAAYLYEGEHPDDAAKRVLRDQLGIRKRPIGPPAIHSFYDPSSWYPGRMHYDLCFVYEARVARPGPRPAWWSRLEFVDLRKLRKEPMGSAMGDLVRVLKPRR